MALLLAEAHNSARMERNTRRRWLRRAGVATAVVLMGMLFYPAEQIVAPRWEVTVIDDKGARLAGINVRETWQQASVEKFAHDEVAKTDRAGKVRFPKRTIQASLISRLTGCWYEARQHRSWDACGPRSSVWAFGQGFGPLDANDVSETQGLYIVRELQTDLVVEQQSSMITLHHCPAGRSGTGCSISETYR